MKDMAEWMTLKSGVIKSLYVFKFSSAKITQASTAAAGIKQLFSYVRHSKEILQALQDPTSMSDHSNIFCKLKRTIPPATRASQSEEIDFRLQKIYIPDIGV